MGNEKMEENNNGDVRIVDAEVIEDPFFAKFVSDLTRMVTPAVQEIVADKLANDNQFLRKECNCCKCRLNDGATELNVFNGKGYNRYLFCDDCTERILNMQP